MKLISALSPLFLIFWLVRDSDAAISSADALHVEQLMRNLNRRADPCEDFYNYACGNWANSYKEINAYLDAPGYMDHKMNEELLDLLRSQRQNGGIYAKLWQYYESCEELKKPALNHYLRLIEQELNFTWPIMRPNWKEPWPNATQFDWLTTLAILRLYGFNGELLTQNVNRRLNNGSHYLIQLHQHQPQKELQSIEVMEILRNFGLEPDETVQITEEILDFGQKLNLLQLQHAPGGIGQENITYRQYFQELKMKQLLTKLPQFDWVLYFRIVLNREIDVDRELVQTFALDAKYFEELLALLASTSNETICNYLMFKFMYHLIVQLPLSSDRTLACVKHLRGHMPLAMNFVYEEHNYKLRRAETDVALQHIYDRLRANFERLMAENHLQLNEKERAYIQAELRGMRLKIGNIPATLNRAYVDVYYVNVTMNATDFYANHLQLLKHATRKQQALLSNAPILTAQQFYEHDAETESSSSPVKVFDNAILVPYGFLQPPLYTPQLSELYQYSLFGFILAHEIMHAYDMFHIVYDQHGNYNELGVEILQHYNDYINCTAQQPQVDSFSENLADVAGLRLAYQTYFEDVANSLETHQPLLGGNLSAQQLFFINSAQFLCANMPQIDELNMNFTQLGHDLHDVRVRQNWANFERFSDAFQCDLSTNMHPIEHCRLW